MSEHEVQSLAILLAGLFSTMPAQSAPIDASPGWVAFAPPELEDAPSACSGVFAVIKQN